MRSGSGPVARAVGEFVPGYEAAGWQGFCAPSQTPPDIVAKLNREMVQLQSLGSDDDEFLRATIAKHAEHTGSAVAERVLAAWEIEARHFRKVMPVDYERVLTVMRTAEAEGLDEEATLARVMEASRG